MASSTERIISRSDTLYIYYCGVHGPNTGPKRKKMGLTKHSIYFIASAWDCIIHIPWSLMRI